MAQDGVEVVDGVLVDVVEYYDASVWLVSNVNGDPLAKDDNGFISTIQRDGTDLRLKRIDGASPEVELHAPKGLAQVGMTLYVADIDQVRRFDLATGKQLASIPIPGATALNEVVACGEERVCVSDAALDGAGRPVGKPAIYLVDGEKVTTRVEGPTLGHPTGLAVAAGEWYVVGFDDTRKVHRFDDTDKPLQGLELPFGKLDGLFLHAADDADDSTYVVASADRGAVLELSVGMDDQLVERVWLSGVRAADVAFEERSLAVTLPAEDAVVIASFFKPPPNADEVALSALAAKDPSELVDEAWGVYVDKRWRPKSEILDPESATGARLRLVLAVLGSEEGGTECHAEAMRCTRAGHDELVFARFAKNAAGETRLVGVLYAEGMIAPDDALKLFAPVEAAIRKKLAP